MTEKHKQGGGNWILIERHKPVYKGWLHIKTMNNEVSEELAVQLDVSNQA